MSNNEPEGWELVETGIGRACLSWRMGGMGPRHACLGQMQGEEGEEAHSTSLEKKGRCRVVSLGVYGH
jgi:hypothetical protein